MALEQEDVEQDDEEDVPDENAASSSPGHATAEAAAAAASATAPAVGDGDVGNEGSQQEAVLQRPESSSSAPAPNSSTKKTEGASATTSGVSGASAQTQEAGKGAGAQEPLVSPEEPAESTEALATTPDEEESQQAAAARSKELGVHKAFLAMLGERSYDEKRQTLDYLADSTSRGDNPRIPAVSAARKQDVLLADRSVNSWPKDVVMNADYEGLSSDLADERIRAREDWRAAPSAEWMQLVPPMKRRAQQQPAAAAAAAAAVRRGGQGDPSPRRGPEGSAFQVFKADNDAESAEGTTAKRPRLGTRLGTRLGYDRYGDDELFRVGNQARDSARARRPVVPAASPAAAAFSPGTTTSTSLVRAAGGGASRTPNPARARGPRGGPPDRRRVSIAAPLRYRNTGYRSQDYTPLVHKKRRSVGGGQRFGAGTLGDFLGETGTGTGTGTGNQSARSPSAAGANDGRRSVSDRLGCSPELRGEASKRGGAGDGQEGQDVPLGAGGGGRARGSGSPAAGSKRAASYLGLAGMNATPRRRALEEAVAREGEMLVKKVEAEAEATAFVGDILMKVVSQESKSRDVGRQVREEQARRANKNKQSDQQQQQQQKRVRHGQVRSCAFLPDAPCVLKITE